MFKFNVTFETITPESAEHGDTATTGFIIGDCSLREALKNLGCGDFCEASEFPVFDPNWLTMYGVEENYATGEIENRSLHFPDNITSFSKIRIARLLNCYGCS